MIRGTLKTIAIAVLLAGCATPYTSDGLIGGFSEKQLEPEVWRVTFAGNGYTTPETAQTYWLYRAANLTLDNGYDGFQILSNINLVRGYGSQHEPVMLAAGAAPIFIPMYTPDVPHPSLEADIRLLKLPFTPVPDKLFNAAVLKAQLDPIVNGPKCNMNNVCPHVHHYIYEPTNTMPTPSAPPASATPAPQAAPPMN